MIDGLDKPGTPGWWMLRLSNKMRERRDRLDNLNNYYTGNPPLPDVAPNLKKAYAAFQKKSRTNFAELGVEAVRDRMQPTGFLTSGESNDELVLEIWEQNGLGIEVPDMIESMLSMGDAYMIVGEPDDNLDDGIPLVTAEDPRQVVTEHDPARQRRVVAALKLYHDSIEGADRAFLHLPGGRLYAAASTRTRLPDDTSAPVFSAAWDWDFQRSGIQANVGEFESPPVYRFRNRRAVGEFEPHLDILDRINYTTLQRLVVMTMQAFRQRAIKNLPEFDREGNKIDYSDFFTADPGALWQVPEGVDFWESAGADLTPILTANKADIMQLAAVMRTPLSYLTPDAMQQSAEGAALAREGLVFKCEDRIRRVIPILRAVLTRALRMMGEEDRARALRITFASPERRSLAEKADAASKAQDIPWRSRMSVIYDFDPPTIDRMASERAEDALLVGAAMPAPAPAPAAPAALPAAPALPAIAAGNAT